MKGHALPNQLLEIATARLVQIPYQAPQRINLIRF